MCCDYPKRLTKLGAAANIFPLWKFTTLESLMSSPFALQVTELIDIIRQLMSMRSRFKVDLPEDLVQFKARVEEAQTKGMGDRHLLFVILVVLSRDDEPVTMGELSRRLDVPLSTATRIVDWLVSNGFAERVHDPADRRVVRVTLTEMGQSVHKAGNEFLRKRLTHLLRRFTPEERETLVVLMRKMAQVLEEEE
jgi:DNA-binding MarR family transcriptional regulator